ARRFARPQFSVWGTRTSYGDADARIGHSAIACAARLAAAAFTVGARSDTAAHSRTDRGAAHLAVRAPALGASRSAVAARRVAASDGTDCPARRAARLVYRLRSLLSFG